PMSTRWSGRCATNWISTGLHPAASCRGHRRRPDGNPRGSLFLCPAPAADAAAMACRNICLSRKKGSGDFVRRKVFVFFLALVAGGVLMSPPVLSVGQTAEAPAGGFRDVPETHWARETIEKAVQLGIVEGYPDGRFGPEDIVQADQLLAMIYRAHIRE